MSQQSIAAVEDVSDGVDLVLAERDLRVHAAEIDVTAIILAGAVAVEQDIVGLTDGFAPVRVFPDPLSKSVFNEFLLALGDGGFLFVEDSGFPAIGIVHICSLFRGRRTVISVSVTAIQLSRYTGEA